MTTPISQKNPVFEKDHNPEQVSCKLKPFGFAIIIILGIGSLGLCGVGIGGYFHIGSLSSLSQVNAIIFMTAGAGGGIIFLTVGIVGCVKAQSKKILNTLPVTPHSPLDDNKVQKNPKPQASSEKTNNVSKKKKLPNTPPVTPQSSPDNKSVKKPKTTRVFQKGELSKPSVQKTKTSNSSGMKQPTSFFKNGTPFYDFSKNQVGSVKFEFTSDDGIQKEAIRIRVQHGGDRRDEGAVIFRRSNSNIDIFKETTSSIGRVELHDQDPNKPEEGKYFLKAFATENGTEPCATWSIDTHNSYGAGRYDWYWAKDPSGR